MSLLNRALAALKRVAIVVGIAIAFSVGLIGALILSLSSSQTRVPDIVGRDRAAAEDAISAAHLNFRVRATRPAGGAKPNTVLIQIPSAGEEVKVGQTVAVDLSRPAKEGESTANAGASPEEDKKPDTATERAPANTNENRPRRNKNTNKTLNDNQNANSNGNRNRSTDAITNSNSNGNHNLNSTKTPSNTSGNSNNRNNRNGNSNTNRRRPIVTPTPN